MHFHCPVTSSLLSRWRRRRCAGDVRAQRTRPTPKMTFWWGLKFEYFAFLCTVIQSPSRSFFPGHLSIFAPFIQFQPLSATQPFLNYYHSSARPCSCMSITHTHTKWPSSAVPFTHEFVHLSIIHPSFRSFFIHLDQFQSNLSKLGPIHLPYGACFRIELKHCQKPLNRNFYITYYPKIRIMIVPDWTTRI